MQKEKRLLKQVAIITIEPYLAEYISEKYGTSPKNGGVKIPYTSDLHFCIWEHMSKCHANQTPYKDPAYYNHLSPAAIKEIEAHIRRMFNFELHRVLLENEEFGRKKRNIDIVHDFIHAYNLKSISSDALLKNFYRFRNKLRPKQTRKYKKAT